MQYVSICSVCPWRGKTVVTILYSICLNDVIKNGWTYSVSNHANLLALWMIWNCFSSSSAIQTELVVLENRQHNIFFNCYKYTALFGQLGIWMSLASGKHPWSLISFDFLVLLTYCWHLWEDGRQQKHCVNTAL